MNQNAASHWTESQEEWVWNQITKGEIADFNEHPDGGGELDPKNDTKTWPEFRKLTNKFLNDILFGKDFSGKPYMDSIPRTGVQITGAWFDEAIDISSGVIERRLEMVKTRFNGPVDFSYVIAKDFINLDGSRFADKASFSAINIRSELSINTSLFDGEVNLKGATIGSQVDMCGSNFKKTLAMDRMIVTDSLFMDTDENSGKTVFEGEVRLLGAQIGGEVNLRGSNFKQELAMDGMKVTGSLFMATDGNGGKALFGGEVRLNCVEIGGQVDMSGSNFKHELVMDGIKIASDLFMATDEKGGKAVFEGEVRLLGVKIGGQVSMKGATFKKKLEMEMAQASDLFFTDITMGDGANFYCLSVKNNLILETFTNDLGWKINLSHAKVGVLRAEENSWPSEPGHVDLTGFTYERIKDGTGKTIGEIGWFEKMLNSQERFTPQPYEQLAKVLMAEGYKDKAEDILYKKRVLERKNTDRWSRKFLMLLLEWCIGYGYRNYLIGVWIIVFVTLGVISIWWSGERASESLAWMVSYSLDMLLPIVELEKKFTKVIWCDPIPKYYFYFQQCVGYVLAIFIAAGLSGLTKK